MERIRREPYNFSENFSGNWDLFQKVLKNREAEAAGLDGNAVKHAGDGFYDQTDS